MKLLMGCLEEGKKMGKGRDGGELGRLRHWILERMGMLVTHKCVVHFSSQTLHLMITVCPTFFLSPIPNFFFLGEHAFCLRMTFVSLVST